MNKKHKRLLTELKKIATHFKLTLSKIQIIRKTALALDLLNKKLVVMDEKDRPYFKTIDLGNVQACTLKVDYRNISAGELSEKTMEEFIDNVQLKIAHVEPEKSVHIRFYDKKENNIHELRGLINIATSWRDRITSALPSQLQRVRA
jgi:hypothetical protein